MFTFNHVQFSTVDLDTTLAGLFQTDDIAHIREKMAPSEGNYFIIHAIESDNETVTLRISHGPLTFPEFMKETLSELEYFTEKQFVENLLRMTTILNSKWAGEFCTQLSIEMGSDGVMPKPLPHGVAVWWNKETPCVQVRPLFNENKGVNDNLNWVNIITGVLGSHLLFWTINPEVRKRLTRVVDMYHKIATN